MNKELASRLINYKFKSALQYLEGEKEETKDLVNFLAKLYGNVGWILGDMAILIDNALENIQATEEFIDSEE